MERLSHRPEHVFISTELPLNHTDGVSNTIRHVIPQLTRVGVDVTLVSPSSTKGIKIPQYQEARTGFVPWGAWDDILKEGEPPDLIHAFAPINIGLMGIETFTGRVPVVASFNTNIPEYTKYYGMNFLSEAAWRLYRYIHNNVQLNLAPSQSVKKEMEEHGIHNVKVWGRGVDSQLFSPEKRSEEFRNRVTNSHPEKPILLYVGRMAREKNLLVFESLIRDFPDAQFIFVGGGPIEEDLKTRFSSPNVAFLGFLHGEDLAKAYASSDVFIDPSLTEGYPNVVLEAFASGAPVVGFDALGIGDLIRESKAGLLARPNDIEKMKAHITELLQNKDLREFLKTKGRQFALTRTWEKCFEELLDHYSQVLSKTKDISGYPVREIAHVIDEFTNFFYRLGLATQRSRIDLASTNDERSLGNRIARAGLFKDLRSGKITRQEANARERQLDEFDRQFFQQKLLTIDPGELGLQQAYYVDIQLPATDRQKDQKPIFIIPGRSGDVYGIEPLIRALALQGRRVVSISYPESFLGKVSKRFMRAVMENQDSYEPHTTFFKNSINNLLPEGEIELWSYSAGGPITAEILSDPEFSNRVSNAVALSPASSVKQTSREFAVGIVKEVWRLLHHPDEFPLISEVRGAKGEIPFAQQWRRDQVSKALLEKTMRKSNAWSDAKVIAGGNIFIIDGTKSVEEVHQDIIHILNKKINR